MFRVLNSLRSFSMTFDWKTFIDGANFILDHKGSINTFEVRKYDFLLQSRVDHRVYALDID